MREKGNNSDHFDFDEKAMQFLKLQMLKIQYYLC